MSSPIPPAVAFIGGGNMAGAILGGLLKAGRPADSLTVVEPGSERRTQLSSKYPGLRVIAVPDASLASAALVVWAVKPQVFVEAAAPCAPYVADAVHLSIMAGVRCDTLVAHTGAARIVRTMPNTPALIGQGMTGLYATEAVDAPARALAEAVLEPTGALVWVEHETDLDAVTALSGSGPAYMFYVIEAMVRAGEAMGLPPTTARQLAEGTMAGAAALSAASDESPATLRERVTSKGGTTAAALAVLTERQVGPAFEAAIEAARARAEALGRPGPA